MADPFTPDILPGKASEPLNKKTPGEEALQQVKPPEAFDLQAKTPTATEAAFMAPSPMDISFQQKSQYAHQQMPTKEDLAQQAKGTAQQMDPAKEKLNTPNLTLKPSTVDILSQHLDRVGDNIAGINSRLGLTQKPLPKKASGQSPIEHFLDYFTGSQEQLKNIAQSFSAMDPKHLNPATMLTLQIKMSSVQQQVEFFTIILGKAVDNIKTLMNIQS